MRPALIILAVIAVLGLGSAGFLYVKTQSLTAENGNLQKEISGLQDEKIKLETELAILKNTDLAKENQRLEAALQSTEYALASEKRDHGNAKNQLAAAEAKIKTLETTFKKAKLYAAVLKAFDDWQYNDTSGLHILDRDTRTVDNAISSLGDSEISDLWGEVKTNRRFSFWRSDCPHNFQTLSAL